MAPEEVPGILPGKSQKEDHQTPIPTRPEKGEGALLLGMIGAGDVIALFVIQSVSAPVVATPMTGKGDRCSDRVSWEKKLGLFFRKIPLIYWA